MHLFISSPVHGAPETEFVASLLQLTHVLAVREKISHTIEMPTGESLITRARNNAVARFLESPATHLFFIDSDQQFTPDEAMLLVRAERPIVGALIPKKQIDWDGVRRAALANVADIEGHGAMYVVNPGETSVRVEHDCAPVNAVGTGFMLVERSVITRIIEARPDIAYLSDEAHVERKPRWAVFDCAIDPETKRYLSEDYEFCRRARAIGIQPYVHVGVRNVGHVGRHVFRGDVSCAFQRGRPA